MKRHNEPQVKPDLTPSNGELNRLRAAMESKVQERQNGRLQSRFFQVMYEWGVLGLQANGTPMVRDPYAYTKWSKAESMIEAADRNAEESFFLAHPEEREKADERVRGFIKEIRTDVFGLSRSMKITQPLENK